MGAIGEYVHYRWENYIKYGTTRKGSSDQYNGLDNYLKSKRAKIKKSISDTQKDQIETALSAIMTNSTSADENIIKVQSDVQKALEERFDDLQNIDFETGKVAFKRDPNLLVGKIKPTDSLKKIRDKVERLEQSLAKQAATSKDANKIVIVQNQIKDVMIKELTPILDNIDNTFKRDKTKRIHLNKNTNYIELRKQFNEIIDEYAKYPGIWAQQGALFEEAAARLPDIVEDIITAEMIATNMEGVTIEKDKFTKWATKTKSFGDLVETTSSSQGKIDVSITWKTGEVQGLSLKNVNLDKYFVRLVSGSPLLNMIQDMGGDNVNHLLNIFAIHPGSVAGSLSTLRKSAAEDLRLVLLYKALSGDVGAQRSKAEYLVVNDNSRGHGYKVRVFSIADILDQAERNRDLIGVQANGKTLDASFRLKNTFSKVSANERIAALLVDAHSKKISASLSTSVLTK